MKTVRIYQALEYRNNNKEIEAHGPYWCSLYEDDGNLKQGIKEPWLGEGYYFWDSRIEDADWWGQTVYHGNYVIAQATYDQHSPLILDLQSDVTQNNDFFAAAILIKNNRHLTKITFPVVLSYLKEKTDFIYKAVRAWPYPDYINSQQNKIYFPDNKNTKSVVLRKMEKIQLCFFDKTLINLPYSIVKTNTDNCFTL